MKQPKWDDRTRVGVHLGASTLHASLVALILNTNTNTGLVSPQFHCQFDDHFNTVNTDRAHRSTWLKVFTKTPTAAPTVEPPTKFVTPWELPES